MKREGLTPTEEKVLRLLALGYTNVEVAEELSTSPRTVESHRKNIYAKLDIKTRRELMTFAMAEGYINSEAIIVKVDDWRKWSIGLGILSAIAVAVIVFLLIYQAPFEPTILSTQPEQMTFALDYPVKIVVHGVEFTFTCADYQWYLDGPIDFMNCNIHAEDATVFWQRFKVYLSVIEK